MSLRARIHYLESSLTRIQDELRHLQQQNEQLRARLAGLALAWRVSAEVRAHRRAFGAACGEGDGAAWQLHLDTYGANAAEALALLLGVACDPGSGGGGGSGGAVAPFSSSASGGALQLRRGAAKRTRAN